MVIKKAIKNEKIQLYNNGKLKRDYIYVDDATDTIILALKKLINTNLRFLILKWLPKNKSQNR